MDPSGPGQRFPGTRGGSDYGFIVPAPGPQLPKPAAEICLECVHNHPGVTTGEIGEHTGMGHPRAWRRLSDLKYLGRVIQGAARQ